MDHSEATRGKSRVVKAGGRDIHLSEFGQGHPLLMLHGGGPGANGLSNYTHNIEVLAKDFRVLVPDMPGYGKSAKRVDPADPFGDLAAAMLALLDTLGIERAHVAGNSLGGACALRMALERPERVSALVLMGPGGIGVTREPPTDGLKLLLGYYAGEGPTREKLASFIRDYLVADGAAVPESLIEERYAASLDPEIMAAPPLRRPAKPEDLVPLDLTLDPRLAACKIPSLVLWGSADKVNRASGGLTLQQTMGHCDLYLFSGTGHWVQWERPDEFNAATAAFLRRHV